MAIKPKGKKVTGTNKADKITWLNSKPWKKNLTVHGKGGNDVINFKKSKYKNSLYGDKGNDKIYGGKSVDKIYGGVGNDKLYGYNGNDIIKGGTGKDYIDGGAGNDKIYGEDGNNTLKGGAGDDTIKFGLGNDSIDGGAGNDSIYGQGGFNTIKGGAGNDTIRAGMWFSNIDGGSDNDLIDARDANKSTLLGGAGDDIIYGGYFSDSVDGGAGNDKIFEYGNVDQYNAINGGAGNDTITVSSGNNAINGGDNDDEISIIGGVNVINAGTGNNQIHFDNDGWPVNYANTIQGGGGTDTLVLHKLNSFDSFSVEYDGDNLKVACGEANDIILENFKSGHSVKYVKIGDETRQITEFITDDQTLDYSAYSTPNTIYGGSGSDILIGGSAGDYIVSGEGDDDINGGAGDDTVVLNGEGLKNLYFGYNSGDDTIKIEEAVGMFLNIEGIDTTSKNINFLKSGNDLIIEKPNPGETPTVDTITFENFYVTQSIAGTILKDFSGDIRMLLSAYINTDSKYQGVVVTQPDEVNTYSFNDVNTNHVFFSTGNDDIININRTENANLYFDYNSGNDTININSQMESNNHFNLHIAGADKTSKLLDFIKSGDDLIIKRPNPNESTDTITIKGYYLNNNNLPYFYQCQIFDYENPTQIAHIEDYIDKHSKYGYASIMGTNGDDTISTSGAKRIIAGGGDDEIHIGGSGDQTLLFEYNSGADTIIFDNRISKLNLWIEGATKDNLVLETSGNDLLIKRTNLDNTIDTITLEDYCVTSNKPDYFIGLSDIEGTSLFSFSINYINGTNNDDTISTATKTYASETITPGKGNDTIIFKKYYSNDFVAGQKTLIFHNGDGNDTVQFEAARLPNDPILCFDNDTEISSYKNNNDLIISRTYSDEENETHTENLTLENWFVLTDSSNKCNIKIGNNTSSYIWQWHGKADEDNNNLAIGDTNTDTYIFGGSKNDTFLAYEFRYKNYCYLEGREGNDTYTVQLGQSQYSIINDSSGNDSLSITDVTGRSRNTYDLFFELNNVVRDGDNVTYDSLSGDLYITYDLNNSIRDKKAGVLIQDYFGSGEIETVQLKERNSAYANLADGRIDAIAQSVATWLTSEGRDYGSVAAALADEDVNLAGLIAAYQPAGTTWQ